MSPRLVFCDRRLRSRHATSRTLLLGLTVALLPILAELAAAQASHSYSPPELEGVEGRGYSPYVGAYPNMRWQTVDGDHLGKGLSIKELAFRLDDRSYNFSSGMGRRFANVSIRMADGDHATFGSDFNTNQKSTPTLVFTKAVSWPTFSGSPLLRPAQWGGLTGDYRFPFSRSWSTTGKHGILSDFVFQGGSLANLATWTDTTFRGYYFDSYGPPVTFVTGSYRSIPAVRLHNHSLGVTGRCNDSAFGQVPNGSYGRLFATVYGPASSKVAWRNHLILYSMSRYTAPQAPVIHAWCMGNDPIGFDLATGCNRLHILGPCLSFTYTAQPLSVDPTGLCVSPYSVVPWFPALASARLTMQAGWADSVTGQLRLTQACEVETPPSVPSGVTPKRVMLMQHGSTVVGPIADYVHNLGMRYGH